MKYLLFLLLPISAYGQSISVSPTSIIAWGTTPQTILIDAEYESVSMITLIAKNEFVDPNNEKFNGAYFGLFYSPIQIGNNIYAKGSVGYFHRKFPTDSGAMLNFRIQIGYKYKFIGIEYSHISNGFGIRDKLNTGVDNISVRIHF